MSTNPYLAYELARCRQEDLRRMAMSRPGRAKDRRPEPSMRRIRSWSLRAPLPRSAPAR